MQVEHVAGESFTSGRTTEQQGHLAITHSLFGEVIVDDQGMLAVVAVVLGHGATGVSRDVLQGSRVGSGGRDDGGVFHGTVLAQGVGHQGDRRFLLADGHVEAVNVGFFLGQDGVDADGGLTGLTVANDQFTLAAADRSHGVDGLQTRGHGLMHALTRDDTRGLDFHRADFFGFDRAEAVDGLAKGVEHAAHNLVAHRHGEDLAGTLDRIALLDAHIGAEQRDTHVVFFEVEHHTHDAAGEFQQFHGHGILNPVDAGDTVTDIQHGAGFAHFYALLVVFDLIFNDLAYLFSFDLHVLFTPLECLPKDRQLRAQTCVQHSITNLEHHAPKDGSIHIKGKLDARPRLLFKLGLEFGPLVIRKLHGGSERTTDNSFGVVKQLAIPADNLAEISQTFFVGQQQLLTVLSALIFLSSLPITAFFSSMLMTGLFSAASSFGEAASMSPSAARSLP